MKKFKIILLAVTAVYIIAAVIIAIVFLNLNIKENNYYRIEINRLQSEAYLHLEELEDGTYDFDTDDLKYVKNISFIESGSSAEEIESFYSSDAGLQVEIVPMVEDEEVVGYLKAEYKKEVDLSSYIIVLEIAFFIFFAINFLILLYIYYRIIKPFNKLSTMPYEMAKGNLTDYSVESKSRYFGRFVWGISMLRDNLDMHKRQELKLAKDKKMMILSISHDIKTPLNAIGLYARAIENGLYDTHKEQTEAAVAISKKIEEIDSFVNEIVKSSTEDVVTIEVKNGEFYLKDLLEKIYISYEDKCRIGKIDFVISEYDNIILYGDIDRIYEAICNLMENAIKYGDGKKIEIVTDEEEMHTTLSVKNIGNPVKESEMSHLFDSFFRGSNTEGKQGSGLGLYICKEIMKKCNGDIYAKRFEDAMEFVLVISQR